MARFCAAIIGLTVVLAAAKMFGAPFPWAWALAPVLLTLALLGLTAFAIGMLVIVALVATHRAEKRDGLIDGDDAPAPLASRWRPGDVAASILRRKQDPDGAPL